MIRLIGTGSLLLLLSGCGAASVQELENHPLAKYEFDAPMGYEATYALIASPAHNCFESDSWAASWYTEGDRNPEGAHGELILSQKNWGQHYYAVIKVVPKNGHWDDPKSHVTVWTDRSDLQHLGPAAERWANGKAMSGERPADCN